MSQNKTNSGNLPAAPGKNLPADIQKKAGGEFVEMQELLPVMSSFQEHLAAEQRKNQSRIRGMIFLFIVLFAAFLAVPVYMGRVFLRQSQTSLDAQRAAQEQLASSLSAAMNSLADASRELREELALQRTTSAAPPPVAAPVAPPAEPVVAAQPEPLPETKPEPPPVVVIKPEPAPETKPEPAPVPAPASVESASVKGDLETLLKQVEDAISQKEKELKSRGK